jgi:hypothetical protein
MGVKFTQSPYPQHPMRFASLFVLLALLAFTVPAPAQSFGTGEIVLLDSLAPVGGVADHVTVAMNSNGDALATWSSSLEPLGSPDAVYRRVEAQFFLRIGKVKWIAGARMTLGEGLFPGDSPIYPMGDICRKPDVVSVGQNFIVAWPRLENADTGNGRIESAFVEVLNTPGDAMYHTESAGIGFPITNADPRQGGLMPDLATDSSLGNDTAVVAFAPLGEVRGTGGFGSAYDFDLVACVIDYSQGGAPQVSTPQILDTGIGFDLFPDGNGGNQDEFPGGKILPDCVFDSQGNLVIAYEEFRRYYAVSPPAAEDFGRIHVRRYALNAGIFILLDANTLYGQEPTFLQRRPNVARSPSNELVTLVWGEIEPVYETSDVKQVDLDYLAFPPQIIDENIPYGPLADETIPVPFQFQSNHGVVISCKPAPYGRLMPYRIGGIPTWRPTPKLTPYKPWRAALDVLEDDTAHGRPGHGLMAFGFEGRVGDKLRTYFAIQGL